MEDLQIQLTVLLLLIEVIAFAWLIIELEHQILKVEGSIMELERTIVYKIDVLIELNKK